MLNTKRTVCFVLFFSILLGICFIPVSAETVNVYTVNGTSINVRSQPKTSAAKVCQVNSPETVTCLGEQTGEEAESGKGTKWYHIRTSAGKEGYIYSPYITVSSVTVNNDFEKNLLNFPADYREPLRKLHSSHPNWVFKADNLPMTFEDAVQNEYTGVGRNLSYKAVPIDWLNSNPSYVSNQANAFNPDGSRKLMESGWYYASKSAVEYYADPKNYFTENYIFSFADQKYDPTTQTKDGIVSIIKDTFLINGYGGNKDAYIDDIMEAAKQSGLNPYVIAATIISEQGVNGTSGLISGTFVFYDADDKENKNPNSGYYNFFNIAVSGDPKETLGLRYAKSQGWNSRRAAIIGGAKYYSNEYVTRGQSTYYYKDWNFKIAPYYSHQYATNVKDAMNNGNRLSKGFGTASQITFLIPVFKNSGGTTPVTPPAVKIINGDTNGDNAVTIVDLANIQKHLLGLISLKGNNFSGADTNHDGSITIVDLANVQKHLLGIIKLS